MNLTAPNQMPDSTDAVIAIDDSASAAQRVSSMSWPPRRTIARPAPLTPIISKTFPPEPTALGGTACQKFNVQPTENPMSDRIGSNRPACLALEVFQPRPDVCYSLDMTAHLAGVPRRSILIYWRAGFVRPVVQPPYGVMEFTEEAIYTVRRIEHIRTSRRIDLDLLKTMFDLLEEVESLRAELRFYRCH
jgi:hypothetical protein